MDEEFESSVNTEAEDKQEHSVSSDLIRGHINTIILRSLYEGDKYGYEIIAEIEEKSHGQYSLKQPTLYSALKRLEKDGYITSYWGGSVGGGRRKYFSLTDEGKAISERNQSEWEYSRTIIDSLISDRDFDFNNPAPAYVNMRVLKDTTSRVPSSRDGEDGTDFEAAFDDAERIRLEEEYAKKYSELEAEKTALETEKARFEQELREREEALKQERELQEETWKTERAAHEEAIAARERLVEEEYRRYEELRILHTEEAAAAKAAGEEELRLKEEALAEERARFEFLLAEKEERINAERALHEKQLEEQEKRIREEQEALFRQREQQLIHQNYINLVNAPPPAPQDQAEYSYYTPPVAEAPAPAPQPQPKADGADGDYQSAVRKIYANAVKRETTVIATVEPEPAKSLDGIDFRDVEARARQDGIRITTAGGKVMQKAANDESTIHKGKALFLSAIVTFFFCIALGSIVLGIRGKYDLPLFYPYFIWGVGLALLLVTGLAYANHYGERAIRRSGPVILINTIVIYALLVIFTLIVALAVNGDFSSASYVGTFIAVPIFFFMGVLVFGIVYYLQVRSYKKQ